MKNIFNSLSVQIIIYLSCLCPPFLSYISYLSLQVRLPALPVSTFVVLHIIPFSTGTSTCLSGVHLCCLTYHTFLYRYVYLPCRCPPLLSYISYLSLQVSLPALPVSTFVVLHIIPFSTGKFTCLAGVHLFCPTFNTFLCRYVYLPCRCPPFFTYISYLSLQDSQPLSYMFIYLINF
jgi:bacteriorhodopsin